MVVLNYVGTPTKKLTTGGRRVVEFIVISNNGKLIAADVYGDKAYGAVDDADMHRTGLHSVCFCIYFIAIGYCVTRQRM